jgi:hypothetical protein
MAVGSLNNPHRSRTVPGFLLATREPTSASELGDLTNPARKLRLGFDQTSNASSARKWGSDPFVDKRDRNVTYTHGLGGPCYGWKKIRGPNRAGTVPGCLPSDFQRLSQFRKIEVDR